MRNRIILLLFICCTKLLAQVGMGTHIPENSYINDLATTAPKGALHLQGIHYLNDSVNRNLGLILPKVDTITTGESMGLPNIVNPKGGEIPAGTMVFSPIATSTPTLPTGCLKVRTSDAWQDCMVDNLAIENTLNVEIFGGINFKSKKLSAGDRYTLAIGYNDEAVYAGGLNTYGRTGTGTTSGNTATFSLILASQTLDVSAGFAHGLAITKDGGVWSWGYGTGYRTGHGSTANKVFAVKIKTWPANVKGKRVEGGYANSLVLGDNGKVYAMGANADYVNGNGTASSYLQVPTEITALSALATDIVDISASRFSGAALTSTGLVYVWGNNANNRIGLASTGNYSPTQLVFTEKIKQIVLGSNHGMAITEDGTKVYGWGAATAFGDPGGGTYSTPRDITGYLPGFDPATDQIKSIAVSRFDGANATTSSGSSIVITSSNIYGAGPRNGQRTGLGYIPRGNTAKYTPYSSGGLVYTFFQPLYTSAIPQNTTFDAVSIGEDHSVLLESIQIVEGKEAGGYGYGMGSTATNQMGAVSASYGVIAFPTLIKR